MPIKISDRIKQNKLGTIAPKENIKAIKDVQGEFSNKLSKLTGDKLNSRLTSLLNEIDYQAKQIEKNFHLSEILKYKKLVKEFLSLTVTNSHKFSKESFLDRRGRHRILSLIKRVNEELENITKDFLNKERNNLKILKRLDDIRGILIDIFM